MKHYYLILSCIALLLLSEAAYAQQLSEKDSLALENAYQRTQQEYKKLEKKHLTFTTALSLDKTKEAIKFLEVLDSYNINFKDSPYWSSVKGTTLNIIHMGYGQAYDLDSMMYYKNIIDTSAYISPQIKVFASFRTMIYYFHASDFREALKYYDEAANHAKASGNYTSHVFAFAIFANIFTSTNNFQTAEDVCLTVDKILSREKNPTLWKYNKIAITHLKIEQGEYQEAFAHYKEMEGSFDGDSDNHDKLVMLSKIYTGLDSLNLAESYINKLNAKQYKHSVTRLKAELFLKRKDYKAVLASIEELRKMDNALYSVNTFPKYQQMLYQAYAGLDMHKEAFKASLRYNFIKDSMALVKESFQIAQENFRVKKDNELRQLNATNQQQAKFNERLIISIIGVSVLLILIIVVIYFKKERRNLQTKMALEHANENSLMKNNLIENLSHEFRTPITIIIGYLNLIKTNALKPNKISNYANTAINNGNQLIQNLNELLTLLKFEDKGSLIKQNSTSENLGVFLRNTVLAFQGVANTHHVHLHYKSNIRLDQEALIEFDYDNLTKLLNNLISNAIKFTNAHKSVYVSCILKNGTLHIKVKDEGVGIPEEKKYKIFDRFYQLEENLHNSGFGIGLSLVKNIVDSWGGDITLKSVENLGTAFKVIVPLELENPELYTTEKEQQYEEFYEPIKEEEAVQEKVDSNLPKALIVEDNAEMRNYFEEILSPYLQCTTVSNGRLGLEKANSETYNIVLSDLKMPIMNGFDFKAELNKIDAYNNVPFLMITASPLDYKVEERVALHINEFIMKPFSDTELISRIKLLLETDMYTERVLNMEETSIEFDSGFSELMSTINTFVKENLTNPDLSVKELAKNCGYSDSHFRRLLLSKTGMTPVKIILEIKLLTAYELIKNKSRQTISEIMYDSGFNSRPYFIGAFSKRFGVKPGEMFNQ